MGKYMQCIYIDFLFSFVSKDKADAFANDGDRG
jgi:hypothetical protein